MFEIKVKTSSRVEAINITDRIREIIKGKDAKLVHIFVPHTTCGIAINEDADPNVMRDLLDFLEKVAPRNYPYRHTEGNADSHVKTVVVGSSVTVPVSSEKLILGTWQGIFLLEFDGPRERRVIITLI